MSVEKKGSGPRRLDRLEKVWLHTEPESSLGTGPNQASFLAIDREANPSRRFGLVERGIGQLLADDPPNRGAAVSLLLHAYPTQLPRGYGIEFVSTQYEQALPEDPESAHSIASGMVTYIAKATEDAMSGDPATRKRLWSERERAAFEARADAVLDADTELGYKGQIRKLFGEIVPRSDIGFKAETPSELAKQLAREMIALDVEAGSYHEAFLYADKTRMTDDVTVKGLLARIDSKYEIDYAIWKNTRIDDNGL